MSMRASTGCTLADRERGMIAMPPDNPSRGDIWMDPNDRFAKTWDGVGWQRLGGGTRGIGFGDQIAELVPSSRVGRTSRKCGYCGVHTQSASEHCPNCAAALPVGVPIAAPLSWPISTGATGAYICGPTGVQGCSGPMGPTGVQG